MIYRIPSIDEINAFAGSNGLNVISTFAGCGGSSTGYKMAGFKVLLACEFIAEAVKTYKENAPSTPVCDLDIREVSGDQLLQMAGIGVGELDVLDGSPPCSAFSMAGLRNDGWGVEKQYSGTTSQRVDDLFFEFARLVGEIQPKVFVAENVTGLVSGTAKGYFKEIFHALQAATPGYRVAAQVLDSSKLGVPQIRRRLIFIGVREDIGRDPAFPTPLPFRIPLRLAIGDLPEPDRSDYDFLKPGTRTRMAYDYTDVIRDGGCFRYAYQRLYGIDARYNWFKLNPSKPCPTLTAKVNTFFRWDAPRSLSIQEGLRIQSFPDDFKLTGSRRQRWERIGRAVPPLMMGHVAKTVAEKIFDVERDTLVDQVIRGLEDDGS
ncbi:MAG: DNA cytosine methyltransferase [Alphaproteobacteria bacterium]|nr:DNA cytosine methyltransferase [Alphaproteobacteria bacterium]